MDASIANRTPARAAVLALVAPAVAVAALCSVPAGYAAASDSAVVTIGQLEAEGYNVNVDRVGSAPLSECTVTSVRNPQQQTRQIRVDGHGDRERFITVVVNRTISVSLDCSGR